MCVSSGSTIAKTMKPVALNNKSLQSQIEQSDMAVSDWRSKSGMMTSDRAIQVKATDSNVAVTYRVHDKFLSKGERKCTYLEHLFRTKLANSVVFPLQFRDRAARVFPQLLDYMYSSPSFKITTENVVALRHLAESLKNEKLVDETWKFIKKDMEFSNYHIYLRDALYFDDKQTATWVSYGCAQNIGQIKPGSPVVQHLSLEDFKRMVSVVRSCCVDQSSHCSEIVAAYCAQHVKEIDERWFRLTTTSRYLPTVSPSAALKLMEVEFQVMKGSPSQQHPIVTIGAAATSTPCKLSSLQRRCVKALATIKKVKKFSRKRSHEDLEASK